MLDVSQAAVSFNLKTAANHTWQPDHVVDQRHDPSQDLTAQLILRRKSSPAPLVLDSGCGLLSRMVWTTLAVDGPTVAAQLINREGVHSRCA